MVIIIKINKNISVLPPFYPFFTPFLPVFVILLNFLILIIPM